MASSTGNRLIYKNTLIIYGRMLLVMFVGLLSSRFVLQALGASDYGLYNVVGGLIATFGILSTGMTTTTSRFLNIEMGKADGNLNKVFNICLTLHILFALLIFFVVESVGVWYIHNMLNVADGKEDDAMFIFQTSTIIACLGIVNVPYQSLIEANEQFGKSALIDISTTLISFAFTIGLLYYSGNALRYYAILRCSMTALSFALFHIVCYRNWPTVIKHRLYRKSPLYKDIFIFNNYVSLGAASSIGKSQGSNLIVNYFFGTTVNASFAVANNVQTYVYQFVNKLTQASNPQLAINYSVDNKERVNSIVEKNSRICILIMCIFFFPIVSEIDFLLNLWLKVVPEGAVLFCTLTLISSLISSFSEGTNGYVQAAGKMKWFSIMNSTFSLLNLPLALLLFMLGYEAHWILICYIITGVLTRINSLHLMKRILGFDVWNYVRNAYYPPLKVIVTMLIITVFYRFICIQSIWLHLAGIFVIFIITILLVIILGLKKSEIDSLVIVIKNRLSRIK